MSNYKSYVMFESFLETLSQLSPQYGMEIVLALGEYAKTGKIPESDTPIVKTMLPLMIANVDASQKRYNTSVENGKVITTRFLISTRKYNIKNGKINTLFNNLKQFMDENPERNIVVEKLKTMPYNEFLNTRYWRIISAYVKLTSNFMCNECHRSFNKLNVHHLSYEHRGEEYKHLEDLVCVCEKCHKELHHIDE